MLLEILKGVLPFIGGGLAGAVLNEWFRRRSSKIQPIPLIERVNRLVNPELKGFALARVAGDPDNRRLEEIRNLREYQMTLRNTSTIHLQDLEIQFEFPTEDVEAWASRPSLSKTALLPVGASITDPWKKGFRWRIPYLPSTDSVEFSFRAVDPPSDDYEVALYKADRVIVQRSKGEPTSKGKAERAAVVVTTAAVLASGFIAMVIPQLFSSTGSQSSTFNEAGCILAVRSMFNGVNPELGTWSWGSHGPWEIHDSVLNIGAQRCVVQLTGQQPDTLEPGAIKIRESYSISRPQRVSRELAFGPEIPIRKVQAEFYVEQHN